MPTITYKGPWYTVPNRDNREPAWIRNKPVEVTTEWMDANLRHLSLDHFTIEGYEHPTIDAGNDGLPDSGWRKADIEVWLAERGSPAKAGYKTKTTLLSLVDSVLNPPAEPVVEAEPEVVEETVEEVAEPVETGDEE